jgi:hypothetical protein
MQDADIVREVTHNECSLNQVEELEAPSSSRADA